MAFMLHRISGLVLALFLPFHFYVLSLALRQSSKLDAFMKWTDLPIFKFAEFGLVFLLAIHVFGGLRLLALEFLPWTRVQKELVAGTFALALLISGVFLLRAI